MNIRGFHEFLVGRLEYLSQEMRWSLRTTLDQNGWPLHLRAMESASFQLEPGASWAPEDQDALIVLSKHEVKTEDIAQLFFEGRTVEECQLMIDILQIGLPVESVEGQTEGHSDFNAEPASSKAISSVPSGTRSAPTPFTKRLIEVTSSASRAGSTPPCTDSRKDWDQADRDIVWNAMHEGLTPTQIQAQRLPFRSASAIRTRMSKERKLRSSAELKHIENEEDEEMTEQRMQIDLDDDGSEYAEDTEPAAQIPRNLPTARKTVPSNSTPKASPKKPQPQPSLTPIRTKLMNSLGLSSEDKKELRKALNKTSWPTRFMSVEEYNSPLPRNGARWTEQDTQALGCIRETTPSLPYKLIANFFPGRSETAIRHQYNTRVHPGPK
ncbi:uncharacterized protein N0V89_003429 [Didymosphaeria variabile]|uniref:Myb-like domain-containing protein n=1 Tax=Didymosphaeria variabile TaxID=1932322 RepID=A0A9W8XQ86_9PLEO|nr:uncharacterized protein N0V89_003429 [Didymosphaeria variabile]KAJ4355413.1 hypothetical protein N0V89_003429 [Didymosphaeria variabile]